MFKKILVANRGIIRLNCVQAVKELGAKAAVFYAPNDNMSIGVRSADEAYQLDSTNPSATYYDIEAIIALAEKIGAEALHPGYGFLAENASFARKLGEKGIKLIGPDFDRPGIELTNKPATKRLANELGVPVVPGTEECSSIEELRSAIAPLGFPLILKSVAASGGQGVRSVSKESELEDNYQHLVDLVARTHGDTTSVFAEKHLKDAQHIEFPVVRDSLGNVVVLPEINGSIQRRFQKLLIETPSAYPNRKLIKRLAVLSRRLVERMDMVGFASVEFLLEADQAYFLEINGYIQPAHVATNRLTGIDLIKEQIRVVAGEELSISQEEMRVRGHVIGVSINAEDPEDDFAPSPGTLLYFDTPSGTGATVYATAQSGDRISTFYDPLVAQVVAVDSTRKDTIRKLLVALDGFIVEGIKSNLPLLQAILRHERFSKGNFSVDLLSDRAVIRELLDSTRSEEEETISALLAALALGNDKNTQEILDAAAERSDGYSFWNFTSRLLNRNKMEF